MTKSVFHSLDLLQPGAAGSAVSRNVCGMFFCRSGQAQLSVAGKVYHIEPDVILFYTPYTFIRVISHSQDWDGDLLEESFDALFAAIAIVPIKERILIRDSPCIRITPQQSRRLERMVAIVKEREAMMEGHTGIGGKLLGEAIQHLLRALCLELVSIYFESTPVKDLPQSRETRVFNQFIISLFRNCAEKRTVAWYAQEQNLSPGHFSVVIRETTGKTASRWIEEVTIMRAKQYLTSSLLTVKEIAEAMNFPDQSTFGRYFKSRVGLSPTLYKRRSNP